MKIDTHYGECDIPGTEDWRHVVTLHNGGGRYDWTEFRAWWSPSARRYLWLGDSGCSCRNYGDGVSTAAAFTDGSRKNLLEAIREFCRGNEYSLRPLDAIDAYEKTRKFKETPP